MERACPLGASAGDDLFVALLSGVGAPVWARALGGSGDDEGAEIAVDGSNRIYLAGALAVALTAGTSTLTAQRSRDVLLAQFSEGGTLQRLQQIGGASDDVDNALEVSGNGREAYAGVGRGTVSDGTRGLTTAGPATHCSTSSMRWGSR